MIKKMFSLLNFLMCFAMQNFGQTSFVIPDEFVETAPPEAGSKDWYILNYSKNEFGVKIKEGKLEIEKASKSNKIELQLTMKMFFLD